MKVKKGDVIEVEQWRNNPVTAFVVKVLSDPYWDPDDEQWEIEYLATGGTNKGYAVWNDDRKTWEDGQY